MSVPDIAQLGIEDADEDLFASPSSSAATERPTSPSSTQRQPNQRQQPQPQSRPQSKQEAGEARDARLLAELERVRAVNQTIEDVTASLAKAKANMATVNRTVANASTLLATWTRILSQTEHNQQLILNPNWQGASQDLEDIEHEESRRQHEAERRVAEEQRRREETQRKAEEEQRKRELAANVKSSSKGLGRARSVRDTKAGQTGVGAQIGRGRGTNIGARGASGISRGGSTARGRGRGMGREGGLG